MKRNLEQQKQTLTEQMAVVFWNENKCDDDVLNEILELLDNNRETYSYYTELSDIEREINLWNRRIENGIEAETGMVMDLIEKQILEPLGFTESWYLDLTVQKLQFIPSKMKKLVEKDRLISFVFKDMMARNKSDEDYILNVLFNTYVLEDSIMENEYLNG